MFESGSSGVGMVVCGLLEAIGGGWCHRVAVEEYETVSEVSVWSTVTFLQRTKGAALRSRACNYLFRGLNVVEYFAARR